MSTTTEGSIRLSDETIVALARACGYLEALVLLLRFSGITWAEAVALTFKRCDRLGGLVEVVNIACETAAGVRRRILNCKSPA